MSELTKSVAVLGRPYSLTKSRLGAVTKVFNERYICDLNALRELVDRIGEKLGTVQSADIPSFSFLISYSDRTHHDGATEDLSSYNTIPIGKQTERVVMRWELIHQIDGIRNELSITVRISNPVNPFVFLQAALSKSPNDIDNLEFEMGSTCVTVDGAGQAYADEIFLIAKNWIDARNKPHPYLRMSGVYERFEWLIDQLNISILPLAIVTCAAIFSGQKGDLSFQVMVSPVIFALFMVVRDIAKRINVKMAHWSRRSQQVSLFLITNGDNDALSKLAAKARNSMIKLALSILGAFVLNVLAGLTCWWLVSN